MNAFTKVYTFTLARQCKKKSYLYLTAIVALLCLLLPILIMSAVEFFSEEAPSPADCTVQTIFVVDKTEPAVDWSVLSAIGEAPYSEMRYLSVPDFDSAHAQAQNTTAGVIAVLEKTETGYTLSVLLPEGSALPDRDLTLMQEYLQTNARLILLQKSGLDPATLLELNRPTVWQTAGGDVDQTESLKQTLSYLLPYLNIMVLYFMILFYGQGVSNHIMLEKTSKLMENFLVYVKPGAMMFGKVLAAATAALMQVCVWVLCLVGGFAVGTACVHAIDPASDMALLAFFDTLRLFGGAFSLSSALLSLLLLIGGFLLYCALAAIGGALAAKPEDLGSTNTLFSLLLVGSFLLSLAVGLESDRSVLLNWIPFTAVLFTPSQILMGTIPVWQGILSCGLVLACAALCLWVAAKIYRMLSFYRGNPPSFRKIFSMLKEDTKSHK